MWKILKDIAKKNKRQLFLTFLLVAMENLMAILYPLFAGFAINAVVKMFYMRYLMLLSFLLCGQ